MTISSTTDVTGSTDEVSVEAPVPFVDLGIQHRRIAHEVQPALTRVMDATAFVLGPEVTAFEHEFAEFCQVANCVGVANGTDAIELALRGAGIGAGDEVIIPANTFAATAEAVVRAGATIVLADCTDDFLLDAEQVARRLTPRTRAVIAVDLYGQIAQMELITEAAGLGVLLFEDAAQSQGATRRGRPAGSFGTAAATSFYPGKNLGAYGDAGATMTADDEIAERIRALRSHGGLRRYEHTYVGTNSRLDSMQAAVLRIKLRHLASWNHERAAAAALYSELLADCEQVVLPRALDDNSHVWHLYVVRVGERDRVISELSEAGINAGIHYPAPIHRLQAFQGHGLDDIAFPVAEATGEEILSLPIFPGITTDQQHRVVTALQAAVK